MCIFFHIYFYCSFVSSFVVFNFFCFFYIIIVIGDFMNCLEINKIMGKMIGNTRCIVINLEIVHLKNGLDFKIDTRGYRLKEVDQFLDVIIGDYEQFLEIISNLEKEKADLLAEIMNLKQELRNSKLSVEMASNVNSTGEVTNVDVMRRLSRLEKMVYGNKSGVDSEKNDN